MSLPLVSLVIRYDFAPPSTEDHCTTALGHLLRSGGQMTSFHGSPEETHIIITSRICLGQICLLLLPTQAVPPGPFSCPHINASSAAAERMARGNRERLGCPAEGSGLQCSGNCCRQCGRMTELPSPQLTSQSSSIPVRTGSWACLHIRPNAK